MKIRRLTFKQWVRWITAGVALLVILVLVLILAIPAKLFHLLDALAGRVCDWGTPL